MVLQSGELLGVVTDWDDPRGIGSITSGEQVYPFQCTQIADGTRTIESGAQVRFRTRPWHLGRLEAIDVHVR